MLFKPLIQPCLKPGTPWTFWLCKPIKSFVLFNKFWVSPTYKWKYMTCMARWATWFRRVYLGFESNSTLEHDFQNLLSYINPSVGKRCPTLHTDVLGPEKISAEPPLHPGLSRAGSSASPGLGVTGRSVTWGWLGSRYRDSYFHHLLFKYILDPQTQYVE